MATDSIRKLIESATEHRNDATLAAAGLEGETASLQAILSIGDSLLAIALVQAARLEKSSRMDGLLHDNLPWMLERARKVLDPPAETGTNWPALDALVGNVREEVRKGTPLPDSIAGAMRALEGGLPPDPRGPADTDVRVTTDAEHGVPL